LQATGKTKLSMVSQMSGAIFNCIMDPLWIFGIGPFPKMGVAGAALATVSGQFLGAGIALYFNIRYNNEIEISWKKYRMDFPAVRSIYGISLPTIIMQAVGSVMYYGFSRIVVRFTEDAVTVFGSYFKLQSFVFMPIFGLNNGLIPVLAYNYGAKRRDRIDTALRFSLALAFGILCVGTLCFEAFPRQLLSLFNASQNMMDMGVVAMRKIGLHFPLTAIGIILGSVFQAFSKAVYSLIVSLCRQLLVLIPAAWLLAVLTKDVSQVWWCFLAAEIVSTTISVVFYRKVYRDVVAPLSGNADGG
jgi:Na+-driven multidrug efflux pump